MKAILAYPTISFVEYLKINNKNTWLYIVYAKNSLKMNKNEQETSSLFPWLGDTMNSLAARPGDVQLLLFVHFDITEKT